MLDRQLGFALLALFIVAPIWATRGKAEDKVPAEYCNCFAGAPLPPMMTHVRTPQELIADGQTNLANLGKWQKQCQNRMTRQCADDRQNIAFDFDHYNFPISGPISCKIIQVDPPRGVTCVTNEGNRIHVGSGIEEPLYVDDVITVESPVMRMTAGNTNDKGQWLIDLDVGGEFGKAVTVKVQK
ncbi:hypothetical protein [Hyphomicrobium sp. MC1]|uniref:hypothetical protein n=1 Tax=Hyphomicrobium sp. (strain MC1) TaxID=717785 RepID=UPI000213E1CA|nr:hypothetical protein [Hyphomicrobium sp. MC1]CCB65865.1 exported protein of unknown function [Hyphomicrobium sp. MC1]